MYIAVFYGIVLLASQEVFSQLPDGLPDIPAQDVCMDLVFMFDISCSVSEANQIKSIDFSKKLVEQLEIKHVNGISSVRLAAALFEKDVNHAFYLNEANNKEEMLALLSTLPDVIQRTSIQCDTMTHLAEKSLFETYFTETNGDRREQYRGEPVYPNVAIFFTDARTHPRKYALDGNALDKFLNKATAAGITNYVVLLDNNRTETDTDGNEVTKPPLDQLKLTNNDPNRIFDIRTGRDADAEATALANALGNKYFCRTGDDPTCVDLTFAFDVSCSIDDGIKELYKYVSSQTYMELINVGGDLLVSALVFDVTSRSHFFFDTYGNQNVNISRIDNALKTLPLESVKCRTVTERAFDEITRKHVGKNGDRPNTKNVIVLFYDGMTSPLRRRKATIAKARALKEKGVDIHLVRLENNRGKDGNVEFQAIASPDRLFPLDAGDVLTDENKDDVVAELFDKLRLYLCEDI